MVIFISKLYLVDLYINRFFVFDISIANTIRLFIYSYFHIYFRVHRPPQNV
jgi:hypothetical protein